jgi:L-fuconolactonase
MQTLATSTAVRCKLSLSPRGEEIPELLGDPGKGWPVEKLKPYVHFLIEQFGCDRLMWGSDWPILLLLSDFEDTYKAMRQALGPLEAGQERLLFRDTAVRFYGLAVDGTV